MDTDPYAVVITGSRSFDGDPKLEPWMRSIFDEYAVGCGVEVFVTGGAQGPDTVAYDIAEEYCDTELIEAQWNVYGNRAGILRNIEMLEYPGVKEVWDFWDGKSKGTLHCI